MHLGRSMEMDLTLQLKVHRIIDIQLEFCIIHDNVGKRKFKIEGLKFAVNRKFDDRMVVFLVLA